MVVQINSWEELLETARRDGAVYLYGTGSIGKSVRMYLEERNALDHVAGFLVSPGHQKKHFEDLPVLYPDEVSFSERELVIVTTSGEYQIQIRDLLQAALCRHIVLLGEIFCQEILDRFFYRRYVQASPQDYEREIEIWYESVMGRKPDLQNPKTFTEKIQWLKLYDATPIKTRLADKYLVRDWVAEKIGAEHLVPLLGVWDRFEEIDFDALPNQFALKTNHGSGYNLIVTDKSRLDLRPGGEISRQFDYWMGLNFAFVGAFELQYLNIPPKIIAEEYIGDFSRADYDYKFFCFNGVPKQILIVSGIHTDHHQRSVFDTDWNLQDFTLLPTPHVVPPPPRPDTLEEMLRYAEILSEGFSIVRVDFYSVKGHVYFGEMTFTPLSGIFRFSRPEIDELYGSWIQLPPKSSFPVKLPLRTDDGQKTGRRGEPVCE